MSSMSNLVTDFVRELATSSGAEIVSCEPGVVACPGEPGGTCAPYYDKYKDPEGVLWIIVLTGIMMCAMGYGIGANDAANSWATSVGSGAVPLFWATIIAAVGDWLGAVTLGYGVSSKLSSGVSDLTDPNCWACGYCNSKSPLFSASMFGAQTAAAIFLLLATFTAMPVSTTHAITGGIVGGTVAAVGFDCLNWSYDGGLGGIAASWVISPLMAGVVGAAMYLVTYWGVIRSPRPRLMAFITWPVILTGCAWYMTYLILIKAPVTKKMATHKFYMYSSIVAAIMLLVSLVTLPMIKRRLPSVTGEDILHVTRVSQQAHAKKGGDIESKDEAPLGTAFDNETNVQPPVDTVGGKGDDVIKPKSGIQPGSIAKGSFFDKSDKLSVVNKSITSAFYKEGSLANTNVHGNSSMLMDMTQDTAGLEPEDIRDMANPECMDAVFIFKYLLVFNAILESYSHGANDTANATAAFSGVFNLYKYGYSDCNKPDAQVWVMALAGGFVALGVITLGWKVIKTLGQGLAAINFHRGFCVEFGSTLAVVIATIQEMPVSTTHCQVGAIVMIGLVAFGPRRVEWKLVGLIFVTWIITIPFAALLAAMFESLARIYFT